MKSVVDNGVLIKEKKYPYLGYYNGVVVLFTDKNTGTCVAEGDKDRDYINLGRHSNCWPEHLYDMLRGSVKLTNED